MTRSRREALRKASSLPSVGAHASGAEAPGHRAIGRRAKRPPPSCDPGHEARGGAQSS